MANFVTNSFRNMMLGNATRVDLDADTIKAMFYDDALGAPQASWDFMDDTTSGDRFPAIASCPTLGTKTIGSVGTGVFDAADTVFTTLSGDQCESLLLFKDTGTEGTSDLICRWDTATGLPLTPNGADVTVVWASGGILSV